ncbi:hypothetical protein ACLOJK_022471 [Asimina triloba]
MIIENLRIWLGIQEKKIGFSISRIADGAQQGVDANLPGSWQVDFPNGDTGSPRPPAAMAVPACACLVSCLRNWDPALTQLS